LNFTLFSVFVWSFVTEEILLKDNAGQINAKKNEENLKNFIILEVKLNLKQKFFKRRA